MCLFTAAADSLGYYFKVAISCQDEDAHYVTVTFKNVKDQRKSARLDIPVIYGTQRLALRCFFFPRIVTISEHYLVINNYSYLSSQRVTHFAKKRVICGQRPQMETR